MAEVGARRIEDHADFLGRVVLQQAPQHVAHAVDRAGRLALLVRQWRQRVKCAKQPRRAIDQDQGSLAVAAVLSHASRSSAIRSEEHTSELQSLMRISYAVFCLKKKKNKTNSLIK